MSRKKLLLIDSNALFHRSRSSLSRAMGGEMTTSYGAVVTGTYGYLNTLFSLIEKEQFDLVVPVYDAGGNWRKKESTDYKANRGPLDQDFRSDMGLLIEGVLPALGFTPIGIKGYEADDVIASIAKSAVEHSDVFIFTCDRDLLQCVTEKVSVILFNSAKKVETYGIAEVEAKLGVKPWHIPQLKALSGDASDNVGGIKGIGPKTAASIINTAFGAEGVGELEANLKILTHPKVASNSEQYQNNLKLVTVCSDIEVSWYANTPPSEALVTSTFESLEFKSYLSEKRFPKIVKALNATT